MVVLVDEMAHKGVSWQELATDTDVVMAFGGLALNNSQVASGGISDHTERGFMHQAAARGACFISVSPLASDLPAEAAGEWLAIIPGTDAALIIGILSVLIEQQLTDEAFLAEYCIGWPAMVAYIRGEEDGQVRAARWAADICGISAAEITTLALRLHG